MVGLLRKLRMSTRIFVLLLLFSALPCMMLFMNTINGVDRINKVDLDRYTGTFKGMIEKKLENEVYRNAVICIKLFSDNTLTSIINNDTISFEEKQGEIFEVVRSRLARDVGGSYIHVISNNGGEYCLFRDSLGSCPGNYVYAEAAEDGGVMLMGDIVYDEDGRSYISLIQRLSSYDFVSDRIAVIMYIPTEIPDSYYKKIQNDENMICFITDMNDKIIFSGDRTIINSKNLFSKCLRTEDNAKREIVFGGDYYIYTKEQLKFENNNMPQDLVMNLILPKNFYRESVSRFSFATGTALVLMIIMFAVIGALLSYALTEPVRSMEYRVKAFTKAPEMTETELPVNGGDEIGELSVMIGEMFVRIRELLKKNTKILEAKHKSEFEVLQAQIDPHFIYNTLDIISSIAKIKKEKEIEEIVYALSSFFKISLHNGDRYLSVEEEIEHVASYIKIQEIRWPGRFKIEYSVEEEILGCEIIKTILQPFVENAIKYAFNGMEDTGNIRIRAYKTDKFLVFEIEDNGIGFDTSILESEHYKGVGIKNTVNRILYEYGSECGVSIDSAPGNGTLVKIKVLCLEYI